MNATPVIADSLATMGQKPVEYQRIRLLTIAWRANVPTQASTRGMRRVYQVLRKLPVQMMTIGTAQSPTDPRFSVN